MKLLVIFLGFYILASCSVTRYVEIPVETIRTQYTDRIRVDTLYLKDSLIIRYKSDTVFQDRYRMMYKVKELRDTVNRVDTVTRVQKVEVTKEVNKLMAWQVILMVCGGGLIGLLLYKLINLVKTWI